MMDILLNILRSVLLAVILSAGLDGQELYKIRTGNPYDPGEGQIIAFGRSNAEGHYYLQGDSDKKLNLGEDHQPAVLVFDEQLNFSNRILLKYDSEQELTGLRAISFFKTDSGFIVFCTRYSSVEGNLKAFLILADHDGKIEKVVDSGEIEDVSESDAAYSYFKMHVIESAEGIPSQYIITVTTPSFRDLPERINFIVYNEDLDVTGNHLLDYPDDYIEYDIAEIICSLTGLFFIRVEIYDPFKAGQLLHQLVIYDMQNDDFNTLNLKIPEVVVKKSELFKVNRDIIGLSGYYVEGAYQEKPAGIFYYLFEASTGALLKQNIHPFSSGEKALMNPKNLDSKSGYQNLMPAGLHLTRHNHVLVLFEYNWKSISLIRDQEGNLYDLPFYYANEIFLFRFDAFNQMMNSTLFAKKQMSGVSSNKLGFKSFLSAQYLCLFYNDHPKNEKEYRPDKLKTMNRKYVAMLGKYNLENGEFLKTVIEKDDHEFRFNPSGVKTVDRGRFLFMDQSDSPRLVEVITDITGR